MPRDPRHDILFEPIKTGPAVAKNEIFWVPRCKGMSHAMFHVRELCRKLAFRSDAIPIAAPGTKSTNDAVVNREFAMSKSAVIAMMALAALTAYAAGSGITPGLWEVKIVKQIVDGRDLTAQMTAAAGSMQQMMANMPAAQRAQMEAAMKQHGVAQGSDGGFRICITPEMAKRDKPIMDKDGRCEPATVTHDGNQMTYEFSCTINGATTAGKGVSTISPNLISTHVETTRTDAKGASHHVQNDTQMTFISADCGDVQPPAAAH